VRPLVTRPTVPDRPDLLACVRYGGRKSPTPTQLRLLAAVPKRHTNRTPFSDEPMTAGERTALRRAALGEAAWLHFVDDRNERHALAALAAQAHTTQQTDPAFRAGQAIQAVLLTATAEGLAASFLSHIVEVEQTREQLRRLIRGSHGPRVVLRIGRRWPVTSTPRRAVTDLLIRTPASNGAPPVA
jgi:hypothetical protein